jgi:hypothetical protein
MKYILTTAINGLNIESAVMPSGWKSALISTRAHFLKAYANGPL